MMKERPILMNGAMVRATLSGVKTQTRRIVKPMKDRTIGCELRPHELAGEINAGDYSNSIFGCPGDRLYVRETFALESTRDYEGDSGIAHPLGPVQWVGDDADGRYRLIPRYRASEPGTSLMIGPEDDERSMRWTPSIHMPRWASRILLEIVSIRIERLNSISEADAKAEGVDQVGIETGSVLENSSPVEFGSYVAGFADLWESINGAGSWDKNPWVHVVEFKRIDG